MQMIQSGQIIEQSMKYLSELGRFQFQHLVTGEAHIVTGCLNQTQNLSSGKLAMLAQIPLQFEQTRKETKLCFLQEHLLVLQPDLQMY